MHRRAAVKYTDCRQLVLYVERHFFVSNETVTVLNMVLGLYTMICIRDPALRHSPCLVRNALTRVSNFGSLASQTLALKNIYNQARDNEGGVLQSNAERRFDPGVSR